jgi:hypothetical protein
MKTILLLVFLAGCATTPLAPVDPSTWSIPHPNPYFNQ